MKSAVMCNSKPHIIILLFALLMITTSLPAHAYFYTGGDWGGRDLSLLDGDSLSGNFVNVNTFRIPTGAAISGGESNLSVKAGSILIDGALNGLPVPGYALTLYSQNDLFMNGSLYSWKSILLSSNNSLVINGTVSLVGGGIIAPPQDDTLKAIEISIPQGGGTLSLVPTPIPAAAWLFGSGLLGLAGIRRRQG